MNRAAFFAAVRSAPFDGRLSQLQVDGMTAILDEWDRRFPQSRSLAEASSSPLAGDLRWLAYMLATTFHETARTMQPIREFGRGRGMRYGTTYYGRGFVQLTWEANYRKASAVVGVDLVAEPDRALELPIAATIMFDGMIKGWFTGHKLADHLGAAVSDYVQARRIINGTDRAVAIAGYAVNFERALKVAQEIAAVSSTTPAVSRPVGQGMLPQPPDDPGPAPRSTKPATSGGFFAALVALLSSLFTKGK